VKAGWEVKPLGEVCELKPPKKLAKASLADGELVSFAGMSELGELQADFKEAEARPLSKVYSGYTYFADNDVLVAKITPCFENGKMGVARNLTNGIGFGSSEFVPLRLNGEITPEFLFYYLLRDKFRLDGAKVMSGAVGHKRVPHDYFLELLIPIPPLEEQKRIVAVLDAAFEGLTRAKENAETNLQNARELFERRIARAFSRIEHSKSAVAKTVADIAFPQKGSIRTGPFGSQLLHSEFTDEGIAVLGIDNAVKNEFRWGKSRFISPEKYVTLRRYTVKAGDVIITIITIMGTCGRCAVVPDDIPVAINTKHLCCITLDPEQCLPDYLHAYFLHSEASLDYLTANASGSVMDGLNMGLIKELPVYLPSFKEQKAIAALYKHAKANLEELEAQYATKLTDIADLRQSLLQKAFAGELT
jgi:type I restriction enzyme S subunit